MALMQCRSCSAKFAVGLLRCPQCNSVSELYAVPEETIEAEQEANVPKISVEGGPSNALGQPLETETPAAEATTPEATEPSVAPENEAAMSDATSGASDEGTEPEEDTGADESAKDSEAEATPASAPKPARKTAAKKAAAKAEPTPKG